MIRKHSDDATAGLLVMFWKSKISGKDRLSTVDLELMELRVWASDSFEVKPQCKLNNQVVVLGNQVLVTGR